MQSQYARSLGPDPYGRVPFAGANAGMGASASANPFLFQREMLRRREMERLASSSSQ